MKTLVRGVILLGLAAVLTGCGAEGTTTKSVEELTPEQEIKMVLDEVAQSGELTSGIVSIEEQLEKLQETDSAKADKIRQDLDALQNMRSPAQIKAKAKEMAAGL